MKNDDYVIKRTKIPNKIIQALPGICICCCLAIVVVFICWIAYKDIAKLNIGSDYSNTEKINNAVKQYEEGYAEYMMIRSIQKDGNPKNFGRNLANPTKAFRPSRGK